MRSSRNHRCSRSAAAASSPLRAIRRLSWKAPLLRSEPCRRWGNGAAAALVMRDHARCVGLAARRRHVGYLRQVLMNTGPALTWSGRSAGGAGPSRRDPGSGRRWAGAGIDRPRTYLRLLLLSKSAIVKTPAVLTVGVSLCLWIFLRR